MGIDKQVLVVAAARPNFMKVAPLLRALGTGDSHIATKLVHTGQHYDYEMSAVFFEQLGLPEPDYYLDVGSGSHARQTADVMTKLEPLLEKEKPALVVVVGDVNSTLAASLAAAKLNIPVAHVEAGLRSFDRSMPEEINRVVTDHISSLLLISEPAGVANLEAEGIASAGVHLVGNTMIDSLAYALPRIRENDTAQRLGVQGAPFGVLTLHRPSNVDAPETLSQVIAILKRASSRSKIVFPCHPRTRKAIESTGLSPEFDAIEGLILVDPLSYFDFMNLILNARYALTDSGGIQEETTWLGIPCVTLRENTERPITVDEGTNVITGLDPEKVAAALDRTESFDATSYAPPKLWDGRAAERIADVISEFLY